MLKNIVAKLFGKFVVKGDLVGAKNGIMVFKQTAKDGTITMKSYKNFKPFKAITKKQIADMTDGVHLYSDTKHIFTKAKDFMNKTETNIVSTKYHANEIGNINLVNDFSPKNLVSDVQSIKILPDGNQVKRRVINRTDRVDVFDEVSRGKKSVTSYNKTPEGHIAELNYKIPYSHTTTPSRYLNYFTNLSI